MYRLILVGITGLLWFSHGSVVADAQPQLPDNYPSHYAPSGCEASGDLSERLHHYNIQRLELAKILRHFADDQSISPKAQQRLKDYAKNLDRMRANLPEPDPDTDEFRNFDFQLGIALTSMTLFLNIEDENLSERFKRDRDNPESALGDYLVELEKSRNQYFDELTESKQEKC